MVLDADGASTQTKRKARSLRVDSHVDWYVRMWRPTIACHLAGYGVGWVLS